MSDATETKTLDVIFEIPACNLARFEERMGQLMRKARKLGTLGMPGYEVGEVKEVERRETDLDGETYSTWIEVYPVRVWGESPRLQGWTFMATADYDGGSTPIFRSAVISGQAEGIPEVYKTMGPRCQHCQKVRSRKETFILKHEDGRTIQVGRACLKDFLGHSDPEALASHAEWIRDIAAHCGACEDMTDARGSLAVETFLAAVVSCIGRFGWLPRSKAQETDYGCTSTASRAMFHLDELAVARKQSRPAKVPSLTEADRETAKAALAWGRQLSPRSDYEHNLKAAACREGVGKNAGLLASLIPAYQKVMEQAARRGQSQHVGQVGERLRGLMLVVDRTFEVGLDSPYGPSTLVLMRDKDGSVYKWKSSRGNMKPGMTYTVTGTVKEHGDYKGTAQTVLTRCQVDIVEFKVEPEAQVA